MAYLGFFRTEIAQASGRPSEILELAEREDVKRSARRRRRVVGSLRGLRGEGVEEYLGRALVEDDDEVVRSVAASVLADFRSRSSEGALVSALGDGASMVRAAAMKSLAIVGTDACISAVLERIETDDRGIRARGVEVLRSIRSPGSVEALVDALKIDEPYIRRRSAIALGDIGDERAVACLEELAEAETALNRPVFLKSAERIRERRGASS